MVFQDDAGHAGVLAQLGITADALLGRGGEAAVYALDDNRVARLHYAGTNVFAMEERAALLDEIRQTAAAVPFATPEVIAQRQVDGHIVTIERRLPGRSLMAVLAAARGGQRTALIRAYLAAADQIGDLAVRRPWYGDMLGSHGIRTRTWAAYLAAKARDCLERAPVRFAGVDAEAVADALFQPAGASLVHLDAFPGNMLSDGTQITAVIDFGPSCLIGDRRLDPLAAAIYLDVELTPVATDIDRRVAQSWLRERGLQAWFEPARRWLAAYWSPAMDDPQLHAWCRAVLG